MEQPIDLTPAVRLRARVCALLHARPMTTLELAERLGYPLDLLKSALGILANAGHIERKHARWYLVEAANQPNDAA